MKRQTEMTLFFGQRGSGKSYGGRKRLRQSIDDLGYPYLIYDNLSEHGSKSVHDIKIPLYLETFDPEELADCLSQIFSDELEIVVPGAVPAVPGFLFSPQDTRRSEGYDYFPDICDGLIELKNFILFVDELDMVCNLHSLPGELNYISQYGRHKNIEVIGVTRSPASIPKAITSNAIEKHVYRTNEANHLKYFYDCGFPKDILNVAPHLSLGEHVVYRPELDIPKLYVYPEHVGKYAGMAFELFEIPSLK